MKIDRVLSMDEYLDECWTEAGLVSPPARNARHIPITAKNNVDPEAVTIGCRCDRWGHPCPDCHKQKSETAPQLLSRKVR